MTTPVLRALAVAVPLLPVLTAAPAAADTPAAWEDPEGMSLFTALLIFGGIPLALTAVIVLLVVAPGLMRGDRQRRGVASWTEPEWFGGPHGAENPRGSRSAGELEGSADDSAARALAARKEEHDAGGASARW